MSDQPPETLIRPPRGWAMPDWRDLLAHRDLIRFFVLRDVKVRYRQTALGVLWAVLQPLLTLAVMSLVFGQMLGLSSEGVPYPLFCFAGLILWQYFSQTIAETGDSVTNNVELIQKVYFPRLTIPLTPVLSGLLTLAVSFVLLLLLMLVWGVTPGLRVLVCVPVIALTALLAFSVGSVLAALAVRFRDIAYLVPLGVQLWLFASPVVYSSSAVPEAFRTWYALNPLVGLIETMRWALLGTDGNPLPQLAIAIAVIVVLLPVSMIIFGRLERNFADVI